MPAPPGSQLVCSTCGIHGHNKRSCGRGRRRRPKTKAENLWKFYRLPHSEYLAMLERGCGICGRDLHDRTPDVDHDHSCTCPGKGSASCRAHVRGLLCRSCNLRVGAFERGRSTDSDIALYLGTLTPANVPTQDLLF